MLRVVTLLAASRAWTVSVIFALRRRAAIAALQAQRERRLARGDAGARRLDDRAGPSVLAGRGGDREVGALPEGQGEAEPCRCGGPWRA